LYTGQRTATVVEVLAAVLAGARQRRVCSHANEEDGELKIESMMSIEGSQGLYNGVLTGGWKKRMIEVGADDDDDRREF
jgi:hypothetical protein